MTDAIEGVIVKDRFDKNFVSNLLEKPKVKELVENEGESGMDAVPAKDSLLGDVWSSLFKAVPHTKDADECVGSEFIHRKLMDQAMNSDAYNQLRRFTVLDPRASTLGCMEFMKEMEVPESVKKSMDAVQEAEKALDAMLDADQNANAESDALEQAQQGFDQTMAESEFEMAGAIARAAGAAKGTAEAANAAGRVLGFGTDAGAEMLADPDAAMVLMDRIKNDRRLQEILKMAGRLAPIALSTLRNRTRKASDMIVSVKMGNDLRRVLPHEFAALADVDRELDFLRRYAEEELMEYEMIGNAPEGKGPIIIVKDESGSMSGVPHTWATAIALATAQACQHEKRDFAVVHFGSENEIKTEYFKANEKASLLEMAAHFFNGGTSFESPLREAVSLIDADMKNADILFLTDGVCSVGGQFEDWLNNEKANKSFRLIAIGVNGGQVNALDKVADLSVTLGCDADGAVTLLNALLD